VTRPVMTPSFTISSDGSLVLNLGKACIETTARKAYHELSMELFEEGGPGTAIEVAMDTLDRFLRGTDMARLRAAHPELAGGTFCRVRLIRAEDDSVRWDVVQ
jgi:hypothetical protein